MGINEHYYVGERDLHEENHWKPLDAKNTHITNIKPNDNNHELIRTKVICLGGNLSLKAKNANYMCKIAQSLIGIKEPKFQNEIATTKDIDFVGIGYGSNYTDIEGFDEESTGSLTEEEVTELAKSIFEPCYLDENANIRPKAQILKNFNRITFFSHCYGARVVVFLTHKAYHNMLDLGIDKQIADEAVNRIFSVTYAPAVAIPYPGLQIIPEKDKTLIGGPLFSPVSDEFLFDRFENGRFGTGTVAYKENDNLVSLIVTHMTKNKRDEHPVGYVERDQHWQLLEKDNIFGDTISQTMGAILATAIACSLKNQPRPNSDVILQEVKTMLGESQNNTFMNQIDQIKAKSNIKHDNGKEL